MAVLKSRAPLMSLTLRRCRTALGLSQAQFAAELGVPLETYRTWDSGRRHVRPAVLTLANARALRHDPHALLPLDTLALLVHVHVRTLHGSRPSPWKLSQPWTRKNAPTAAWKTRRPFSTVTTGT